MKSRVFWGLSILIFVFSAHASSELNTKVWGLEWFDFMDEPREAIGSLSLKEVGGSGSVEIGDLNGKVVVVVEMSPDTGWWDTDIVFKGKTYSVEKAFALEKYIELAGLYANDGRVVFLPVWTGGSGSIDVPGKLYKAAAADLHRFTGMTYAEGQELQNVQLTYGFNVGEPLRNAVCVIAPDGKIVYRDRRFFAADTLRVIIDRLLDPAFDREIRQDFPNVREQWSVEETAEGLVYTENFEQYDSTYEFRLDPRWGFSYDYQHDLDYRGELAISEGRDVSQALYANSVWHWLHTIEPHYYASDEWAVSMPTLTFPAPLTNGTVSFYVRKGPDDPLGRTFARRGVGLSRQGGEFEGIKFYSSYFDRFAAHYRQEVWQGSGEQMIHEVYAGRVVDWNGTFRGNDQRDSKLLFGDDWHFIEVKCVPGEYAELFIDGQSVGEKFDSSSLTTVAFSPYFYRPGYYVDDLKITYHGDAKTIRQAHAEAGLWPRLHDMPRADLKNDEIWMTHIPSGTLDQGDPEHAAQPVSLYANSLPLRPGVNVNSFYMSTYPVSFGQYKEAYEWAWENGYDLSYGVANEHWRYNVSGIRTAMSLDPDIFVAKTKPMILYKWCNALSEKEGLTPCYYTDPTHTEVFRSGGVDLTPAHVKWDADGYRLPTVAEWQHAYLGGTTNRYNWWGDDFDYDTSYPPTVGHTSVRNWGRIHRERPGSVPANPFGLYDMGIYYEHCFDVAAPWDPAITDNPKSPSIEDGNETQAYLERAALLHIRAELRRGGKTDNEFAKRANRALMGAHHETYGHPGSVHKRADHPPEHVTPDSMFHVVQSDLKNNPDGSYATGRPEDLTQTWTPPQQIEVEVHTGKDWSPGLIDLRDLPGGSYKMGGTRTKPFVFGMLYMDETPVRKIKLSPFAIGKTEITFGQYQTVYTWALENGYRFNHLEQWKKQYLMSGTGPEDKIQATPQDPVNHVTWYDAVKWCNALSEMEGRTPCYYTDKSHKTVYRDGAIDLTPENVDWDADGYRLPTEAEWEYAARAGTDTDYFWGEGPNGDYFWYVFNMFSARSHTTKCYYPVGQKKPNQFGLHDMAGNIFEWCFDWLGPYDPQDIKDPRGCSKEDSDRLHQELAAWRQENFGGPHFYLDPDPVVGEFHDVALREQMLGWRRRVTQFRYKDTEPLLPTGLEYDRTRRVQRGGNDWQHSKRFGAPAGWPRHDQGFRVVISR